MKEDLQLIFQGDQIQRQISQQSRIEAKYDDNNGKPRVLITSIGVTNDPINGNNVYTSTMYIYPNESFTTNSSDEETRIVFRIGKPSEKK